jgi:hypothetical protein
MGRDEGSLNAMVYGCRRGRGRGAFDRSDKEADVMLREGQMGRVLINTAKITRGDGRRRKV